MTGRDGARLITGAAGFVGACLCRRLVDEGANVHVLVKPSTASLWRLQDLLNQMTVHYVDLTDPQAVRSVVHEVAPTVVYHLATHGAYHYQSDPLGILSTNILGSWNLLDACNQTGYELFVNVGSSSEYGSKKDAMRESDVLEPNSMYAVAKAAQSMLCRFVGESQGRPIVTLRLFSAYGPYEEPGRLIPNLMMAAMRQTPIQMVSPRTVRDFTYIEDVVELMLQCDALQKAGGENINVGTGVQTNLAEIVALLGEINGRPLQASWEELEARPWDTPTWRADVGKCTRLLGKAPGTDVRNGLTRSLEWWREHHAHYA